MTLEELKTGLKELSDKLKAIERLEQEDEGEFKEILDSLGEAVGFVAAAKATFLFAEYLGLDADMLSKFQNR